MSKVQDKVQIALDNRFARDLPELSLPWEAREVPEPELLVLNETLALELGLDPEYLRSPEGVRLLVGNLLPENAVPVAQAYSGHQFGGYSPRLGDGRALLLGELEDRKGRLRDLHLKGSGRTPFSRGGDGLAAVGPMLREYVISEAMHALGVPTTRSLSVVATGTPVRREETLPGAVLARVAASHLRVGTFQYARSFRHTRTEGDTLLVRRLADHAISRHYPEAGKAENPYLALYEAVVSAQAALVAEWMLVGFVHGVMNTDNMTISGETIDYGPCAFMEAFDPRTVYSSIDFQGRYAYGNQPRLAAWNLARLAEALLPLFDEDDDKAVEKASEALGKFAPQYGAAWSQGMRQKLGLADLEEDDVVPLAEELLILMRDNQVDYTTCFRRLSAVTHENREPVRSLFLDMAAFDAWADRWLAMGPSPTAMERVNPAYIPRNHLVEEALTAATNGDMRPFESLLEVVQRPYEERPGLERYTEPAPEHFGQYVTYCGT